jgi:hypothetical protein
VLPAAISARRRDVRTLPGHTDTVNPQTDRFAILVGGLGATNPGRRRRFQQGFRRGGSLALRDRPACGLEPAPPGRADGCAGDSLREGTGRGLIAYHVVGDGPIDLIWLHAFMGGLEVIWEHEVMRSLTTKLASFARVIRHDMRATGLSGRADPRGDPRW